MKPSPIHYGHVQSGKVVFDHPEKYLVHLAGLEGKRVEVSIKKYRKDRSLSQNNFYWAVVVEILGQHFGYEPDECHEALKFQFLKVHGDGPLPTVRSTTTLNTEEFNDYVERIRRWAITEYGVYIPDPREGEGWS